MMAAHATGNRPMFLEARVGVTMAFEAKSVKPRLQAYLQISAAAPMTTDAGVHAASVRKIVVTDQTIDGDVRGVRKVERHAF